MFDDLSSRAAEHSSDSFRDKIWRVIFLSDTKPGRAFDVILLWLIGLSVAVVMIESVDEYAEQYREAFLSAELIFTVLFTIEYLVRIWVVRNKKSYLFSFFGIVDLVSILPTYLMLLLPEAGIHYIVVVRVLRLLRIFRVL
ncbi:MAG: ion transporter, partial [Verrucomicrobiota bacterium]